ncbi:MAG: putative selenate reductase subunit YgfK [Verrucomicrobia bacterium]|nr:putative selenate reductase subunit YgfK [Verrucomicrobiota bacterium]
MSDKFQPIAMEQLCSWIFTELEARNSIFGIPLEHAFLPASLDPFTTEVYGCRLETPFGVAAGPHSQMAQNIIVAWLCGARFMELKTVQTLDELEVSKPCIDMEDEGYNVEWSQELKVHESFDEYLRAWILLHTLHGRLGFPGDAPGICFNMSVGYDLAGILKPNVQWFLKTMLDSSEYLERYLAIVEKYCREVRDINIPARLSDSVTLSTMHGCPPDEIEKISAYLMTEWNLHTSVKLNPTLLGPDRVRGILNTDLGYHDVVIPDVAFEHDLKYGDAIPMLNNLRSVAKERSLTFGVKLTNTLEVENVRNVFDGNEKMMYLSGRPLHAVTANLAATLAKEFSGDLLMSFSAGADAFNVASLLGCGMKTITVCSDILKSGGYMRMLQYVENTKTAMQDAATANLAEFICKKAGESDVKKAAVTNAADYAAGTLTAAMLRKDRFVTWKSKTARTLDLFDCIEAPCTDECPINQKVPQYMSAVREGRFEDAIEITRGDNALSSILGRVCDHLCENTCVRTHFDEPLAIRDMKRYIMSKENAPHYRKKAEPNGVKVGIIGGGPGGMGTAYELARAGFDVTIFEAHGFLGGMVSGLIPIYRLPQEVIDRDVEILENLGVGIRYNVKAGEDFFVSDLRKEGFKHIVVAVGAQQGKTLGVEDEDAEGVMDALYYLRQVREGKSVSLGKRIGVIGAGDTAMDCARSAWRIADSKVMVIYRRTIDQMPADKEEIHALLEEGIEVAELVSPGRIVAEKGKLKALVCRKMMLGERGEDGRKKPVEVPGEEVEIELDNLILAISQNAILDFLEGEDVELNRKGYMVADPVTHETSVANLYAGGDVCDDGPSSIVKAVGDGKKIAAEIMRREGIPMASPRGIPHVDVNELIGRRAKRQFRVKTPHIPLAERKGFAEVVETLSDEDAKTEASRCVDCDRMCSICVSVCPNLAIVTYRCEPFEAALPKLTPGTDGVEQSIGSTFRVDQGLQVAVLTDFCNECGNCVTFCPTAGRPYVDKPRLYLNRKEFEEQTDNAFMLFKDGEHISIDARWSGETHSVSLNGKIEYSSPHLNATVDPEGFRIEKIEAVNGAGELSLRPCATMYVLLKALIGSLPQLPLASRKDARGTVVAEPKLS